MKKLSIFRRNNFNGTSIEFFIETQGTKMNAQPRNSLESIFQLKMFVIIVEANNSHAKYANNSQILVQNLAIWIGCILIGGFIYLFMQKSAGIVVNDLSTPFLDLTKIFFGWGGIRANRSFIRIFVIQFDFQWKFIQFVYQRK